MQFVTNTREKPKTVWISYVTFLGACPGGFFSTEVYEFACILCLFEHFVRGLDVDLRHRTFKRMGLHWKTFGEKNPTDCGVRGCLVQAAGEEGGERGCEAGGR